ncbi:universal stress protein [Rhodanobacter umsongensis]
MAEEKFRSMLGHRTRPVEWRSNVSVDSPSSYVAHQARSADLVMTGVGEMGFSLGGSRRVDTSDLIMQLGRPVMIVPDSVEQLRGRNIVIGWKNTREARRVTVDALPWLKQASRVTIIHIVDDGAATSSVHDGVEDVAGWLHRHGIDARGAVVPKHGDSESQLEAMARAEGADLIVAGAYGHSRLKEWVLGGMTADLLLRASICSLMSH